MITSYKCDYIHTQQNDFTVPMSAQYTGLEVRCLFLFL